MEDIKLIAKDSDFLENFILEKNFQQPIFFNQENYFPLFIYQILYKQKEAGCIIIYENNQSIAIEINVLEEYKHMGIGINSLILLKNNYQIQTNCPLHTNDSLKSKTKKTT